VALKSGAKIRIEDLLKILKSMLKSLELFGIVRMSFNIWNNKYGHV
jgi:hypothetical protein